MLIMEMAVHVVRQYAKEIRWRQDDHRRQNSLDDPREQSSQADPEPVEKNKTANKKIRQPKRRKSRQRRNGGDKRPFARRQCRKIDSRWRAWLCGTSLSQIKIKRLHHHRHQQSQTHRRHQWPRRLASAESFRADHRRWPINAQYHGKRHRQARDDPEQDPRCGSDRIGARSA